ncbi:unnamed protein product [Prorocentrum cordatum]|uniref:Subtilisin n=1 Tax=Prorocentrum cordatum TaxID=2364126 RepID=A0ABN9X8Q7_9DINO|nr:unnamed protein product [Polarella glacialis]
MGKLSLLLLLLPAADARLRGFKAQELPAVEAPAQEAPPVISCDQQSAAQPETLDSDFDELALLQRNMTPSQGMHQKSAEEWLAHLGDHETKISAAETVLPHDMVASQLAKLSSQGCADDPLWRDADGDSCEIYRFAIESGKATREAACNGGGEVPPPRGLRGAAAATVVADATAKIFCPATCGLCPPAPAPSTVTEQGVDGLDDVNFLQVGVSSASGVAKKSIASWEEHMSDHDSRITPDQQVLDSDAVALQESKLQRGEGCADDPLWPPVTGAARSRLPGVSAERLRRRWWRTPRQRSSAPPLVACARPRPPPPPQRSRAWTAWTT